MIHRFVVFVLLFITWSAGFGAALGRSEGSIQKTWDFPEGIHHLVVDADRHEVVIRAGGPRLSGRLIGDSGDVIKATKNDDTVTVLARTDRSWFSWRPKTARIEITAPAGLEISVTTASGNVLVQVPTAGLVVRTASGEIEASRGGTAADVDSASGNVRIKGFSGPVKASALSGNLTLEEVQGDIQASVLSGNLTASDVTPADKSRFSTVSGNAFVELSGGSERYRVHAETVSGNIEIGKASADKELSVGSGPLVTVKAVSGNVRVK